REKFLAVELGHGEWVVREVDLLLFFAPFIHRKIHNPAEAKFVVIDESKLAAYARTRITGQVCRTFAFRIGGEKHRVARLQSTLVSHCRQSGRWQKFRNGAFAGKIPAFAFQNDVTEASCAHLALRPAVDLV